MYTAVELQMVRDADPGVKIAGVDTPEGNRLPTASLKSPFSLPINDGRAGIYYQPSINKVVVKQAGAVLSGYDFGGAEIVVCAPNVTIVDCTFSGVAANVNCNVASSYNDGLTVTNCTFNGGVGSAAATRVASQGAYTTITNNLFLNTPGHSVHIDEGVVANNYFSGGGYGAGAHADAIQVCTTTGPLMISGNFIDWTNNPDALEATNFAIRIATDCGDTSNITITKNVILGGGCSVAAGETRIVYLTKGATGTLGTIGKMTNVVVTGNDIGWAAGFKFYPSGCAGVSTTGNTIVDFSNPIYADNAWAAYVAAGGVKTQYLVQSTGSIIGSNPNGTTTLYSGAYRVLMGAQGSRETVFVGSSGVPQMNGGPGADIFKFLSVGDSPSAKPGLIGNFDPAKDVIDLSFIDSNPGHLAGAASTFTFIGTSAFTAAGNQIRYTYDAASNMTMVQANLAGDQNYGQIGHFQDKGPDFLLRVAGHLTLTAANFALTADQATSAMAAGEALSVSTLRSGNAAEYLYKNVTGRAYASYESIAYANGVAADIQNLNSGSAQIQLYQKNATVTRGGSAESFAIGTGSFNLAYHANEMIMAGAGGDTFAFSSGFGKETINGFVATGTSPDTLKLSVSAFSYLNASMTQAQDLAAVLSHVSKHASSATIADSHGDSLTLQGVTAATLAANPSVVKFV